MSASPFTEEEFAQILYDSVGRAMRRNRSPSGNTEFLHVVIIVEGNETESGYCTFHTELPVRRCVRLLPCARLLSKFST